MPKRNLLLIGSSSALGIEYIKIYGLNYEKIICHYRSNNNDLNKIMEGNKTKYIPIKADLNQKQYLDQLIYFLQNLTIDLHEVVFLAAPRNNINRFTKIKWENEFIDNLNIQLGSSIKILQTILPKMVKLKSGKILFILSSVTHNKPPKGMSDYIISKYAVLGLMKSLAAEYAGFGLSINSISPSMLDTDFLENIPTMVKEMEASNHPKGRIGDPSDILPAMEFLLSEKSNFITGQNILINGEG
ncbi:SDR family NAD(P)-dependent oxidoreductase [Prochlorococcus marinus]|uniref:SDR family NAD(P)-dependent oxidoreductase n=1 Tax=Prochlorococcus marinus TaxID=1219 RepID=UPI0022B5D51B|nr:SDR family oxidoreductase [Prochlorococcus marinus]